MKEEAKRKNSGNLGAIGVTQGSSAMSPFHERIYDFLFAFHRNCASFLYHFQDKANYSSKVAYFPTSRVGVIPLELNQDLRRPKTTLPRLSYGTVPSMTRFAVLITLRLVTDGRTDTRP